MSEKIIKPYEISVWEDKLTQVNQDEGETNFVETKLAVIGSDKMIGLDKIYNPVFHKKSNGEKTLSFSLKYKYDDPYTGQQNIINPFAKLLTNERKIKLYYENEWYEFVIKERQESSEEFSWDYTCTDAFVLELSKIGYNLTFDAELNNNQGTAKELVQKTIENTDWQLGEIDAGKQLIAEPIYQATLHNIKSVTIINTDDKSATFNDSIYIFYSYVKNQNGKFVQFIDHDENKKYIIDDKNVITDTNFRILNDLIYKERIEGNITIKEFYLKDYKKTTDQTLDPEKTYYNFDEIRNTYFIVENPTIEQLENYYEKDENSSTLIISINEIEKRYQANRLGYSQLTTYDPVMGRTVDRFKIENGDREVYRYIDYTYTTSNVIVNYITNGENFNVLEDGTLQGWNPYNDFKGGEKVNPLELITKPELTKNVGLADISVLSQIEGFLKISFNGPLQIQDGKLYNTVYNSGIENNASLIQSISKGQEFVFRWRGYVGSTDVKEETQPKKLRMVVAKYTQDAPSRFGYYYKHIKEEDIILRFGWNGEEPIELNNEITGGHLEEAYRITGDTSIVDGKTYYIRVQIGTEIEYVVISDPDQNELKNYYELTHNYVIDNVVQTPSTSYIYKVDDIPYIWRGDTGDFETKNSTNYQPYYYLTGVAEKSVPNSVLKDPTANIGIFIYYVEEENETYNDDIDPSLYFIQDIQLTHYIPDISSPSGQTPIITGNVPTSTSHKTEYYYIQPADGTLSEDVVTYTNIDELKNDLSIVDEIMPLYNKDSTKNLSISVSQSNCFDILQTIAETFECWVDLKVQYDDRGAVIIENGIPQKFICLNEYVGKDNYAGFKYGINLESIERTINSDEFVTKLIVDQSQSEYTDEGFVSIGLAPSNISGESYILNFNYYYNQGLLNRDEAEPERLNFIQQLKDINQEYNAKESKRRDLELSMTTLGSLRNTYTELISTAQENKSLTLGEFEQATHMSYDEYRRTHDQGVSEQDLIECDGILDMLGELYVNSAIINNYSGILTNIEKEYWQVRKELRGTENYSVKIWTGIDDLKTNHIYVELNDYLPGFQATVGAHTETSTVSKKFFDFSSNLNEITLEAPEDYYFDKEGHPIRIDYTIDKSKTITFKIISENTVSGIEDEIKELLNTKDSITKAFNNKYSHFIQEGTWNSTDYIDSELYYLDALQISNTSAQPVVSYTINVVEVSQIEGLEIYKFDTGDKTYIEDTEFFGWTLKNGVLTPVLEEVIVSEVEWHLEEPDKNTITVQNYKSRFEDLFQRISATVQTVQYNEISYAKISSLVNSDGTINQDVLLSSLNSLTGQEYNLTSNGSIVVNNDSILVQNLTNPTNRVIINSEGIRVSSDGGETWTTAIDGQGINIGAVYTGSLNTNEVVIGSAENPTFRWDKDGISAYGSRTIPVDGVMTDVTDFQTFVRFDHYGMYGIKNGETFKAENINEIKNKAHFAVTWDGFFIKNNYEDGGRVEITSDNDFQILDSNEIPRVKIGMLELGTDGAPNKYGINIKNKEEDSVFITNGDGDITITGVINARGGNFSDLVTVGKDENDNSKPWIEIDGRSVVNGLPHNATIQSSNYGINTGWTINSDGDATFNNINVRGTIRTSVFEKEQVQAVDGIFLFRPSDSIEYAELSENEEDLILTMKQEGIFKKGDLCKIGDVESIESNLKNIFEIDSVNGKTVVLKGAGKYFRGN